MTPEPLSYRSGHISIHVYGDNGHADTLRLLRILVYVHERSRDTDCIRSLYHHGGVISVEYWKSPPDTLRVLIEDAAAHPEVVNGDCLDVFHEDLRGRYRGRAS